MQRNRSVAQETTVNFSKMSLSSVEELVGRKSNDVAVKGKWVAMSFHGGMTENGLAGDTIIKFKQW